ncbi:unnamed protein product, partial [marine sediment metagenome]
ELGAPGLILKRYLAILRGGSGAPTAREWPFLRVRGN